MLAKSPMPQEALTRDLTVLWQGGIRIAYARRQVFGANEVAK